MSLTYFIQAKEGGPIKIGKTVDLAQRMRSLQTGSPVPLQCIGVIDRDIESQLHRRFAQSRSHGEWFDPSPELLQFIRHNAADRVPVMPLPEMRVERCWIGNECERRWGGEWIPYDGIEDLNFAERMWDNFYHHESPCWSKEQDCDCGCCVVGDGLMLLECLDPIGVWFRKEDARIKPCFWDSIYPLESRGIVGSMGEVASVWDSAGYETGLILVSFDGRFREVSLFDRYVRVLAGLIPSELLSDEERLLLSDSSIPA